MTPTERSQARNARAAFRTSPVTLDEEQKRQLSAVLTRTNETYAAWIRRVIREAYKLTILQNPHY
jgi:hypothetical protein